MTDLHLTIYLHTSTPHKSGGKLIDKHLVVGSPALRPQDVLVVGSTESRTPPSLWTDTGHFHQPPLPSHAAQRRGVMAGNIDNFEINTG